MSENVNITVSGQQYSIAKWLAVVLAIVCIALAGWIVWMHYFKPVERAGAVKEAKAAKEAANVPTGAVPVPAGVQAYPDSVKRKLKLPKAVADDSRQKVIAASKVAPSERPHTITTVIEAETGKVQTFDRTDPLPWVAYSSKGAAGVYYGIKAGEQIVRLQVRQDIVRVKALSLGVMASVDSGQNRDAFVGAGVEYRW
ncbi:MAG: hypothetical protein ABFC42_08565 [Sulfuricella sp.]